MNRPTFHALLLSSLMLAAAAVSLAVFLIQGAPDPKGGEKL